MLKSWYKKIVFHDYEQEKLLQLVQKFVKGDTQILDVGCGYGRYLMPLSDMGYNVLGVEQNVEIVKKNNEKGLNCISTDAFSRISEHFDIIILSHIIEHFSPTELFAFLDTYLSRLKKGGHLIIATPLYSSHFFDDFDHVKPYHPEGIQMVFGGDSSQVQYYSHHKMKLKDIWFRKSPLFSHFHSAKYFRSQKTKMLQCYDLLMSILFKLTFKLVGRKDGWVGVYQKC